MTKKLPTMHAVQSTNVQAIGHSGTDLFVTFKSGGTYRYRDVPADILSKAREAKSIGSFLHAHVRGKFAAERIEETKP